MAGESSSNESSSNESSQYTMLGLKAGWWLGVGLYILLILFVIVAFFFPPLGAFFGLSVAAVSMIGGGLLCNVALSGIVFSALNRNFKTVEEGLYYGSAIGLGIACLGAGALALVGGLIGGVVDIIRNIARCGKPSIDESAGENSLVQEASPLLKTKNTELHQELGNAPENKGQVLSTDKLKDEAVQGKSPVVIDPVDTPAPQPAAKQPPAGAPVFGSSASF